MTQMDLLVTSVAELLTTAVNEVLRLMGQAVSEYCDESARIRQENLQLQHTLEELQNRLQMPDAVQQVSSPVAAEEPGSVTGCHSRSELVEAEMKDSYEEDKLSDLHLKMKIQQSSNTTSLPRDFPHKKRKSFSSPPVSDTLGSFAKIKAEAEFPGCSLSEPNENTITAAHVLLPRQPVCGNSTPPHVKTRRAPDAGADLLGVTIRRENSHTCPVCGKSFPTATRLSAHFVCHSGERPFACDHCNFRFSRLADLKKHKHIHTGEKPYSCTLCGLRFNRKANLRRHLSTVDHGAPVKPYGRRNKKHT